MKTSTLFIHDIEITVVRKSVKNINVAIYPPNGHVKVSAPLRSSDELIRSVIAPRLEWIRKKRASLLARPQQTVKELISGEIHQVFGQDYQLKVIERPGRPEVVATDSHELLLYVRKGATFDKKNTTLKKWYREQLCMRIPALLLQWQSVVGVEINEWRIRQMTSRWGTCNITDRRIWLNLELARMSPVFLEYVLVHELVHLLERYHNTRFWSFMDSFLPDWRNVRAELKQQRLEHD